MRKQNTATWTKGRDGAWTLLADLTPRYFDAPPVGSGEGVELSVLVCRKGRAPETARVRLTSRVFERGGKRLAFAEAC